VGGQIGGAPVWRATRIAAIWAAWAGARSARSRSAIEAAIVATSGPRGRVTGRGRGSGSVGGMAGKRPCSFCRSWFQPDARVGGRQYACSDPECQQRRRRKQAKWRRRNPDYFVGRRWTAALDDASAAAPARSPPPLEKVPWDVVQSQMGTKAAVILGLFVRLLLGDRSIPVDGSSTGNHGGNGQSPPPGGAIPDGDSIAALAPSAPENASQPPRPD